MRKSSFQWKSLATSFKAPGQSCSQFSFSWVRCSPRNELPSCVYYWFSQQISSTGYCRSQRATVWFIENKVQFLQVSNAGTRSTTSLQVNVFRVTELEKIYTELLLENCIKYTPHVTRFAQRLTVELEPFFYRNIGVEICTIGKSVSLCFSEDVDDIISNE